ncbi:MAG: transcription-repair coupling factor [Lachnospiraceae bacterium]|uniref:Transcription-repair-coupling factor n=1 Tax=Candidatus Weimeria bifida TaxID=2599074 RepID=A0A6N7J008_9FIRM|nr:transcription-repair coupling factor [Candidatus Weimeria bifida]RRF96462.1 MAG: transcription-repair coupling factor [Lachnospiraceae bacterium]
MNNGFTSNLSELGEFTELSDALKKGGMYELSGVLDVAKGQIIDALGEVTGSRHKLVVFASERAAEEFADEYRHIEENTVYFPAKDVLFYQSDVKGNTLTRERLRALRVLNQEDSATVVTTVDALMNRLPEPGELTDAIVSIEDGEEYDFSALQRKFVDLGYENVLQVDSPGQFSVRGGIIDIFPLTDETPVRIEFFGDDVDSIRTFDVVSQKSDDNLDRVLIDPAMELVLTKKKLDRGLKLLKSDYESRYKELRSDMKTEESFRLKTSYEDLRDRLLSGDYTQADGFLTYFEQDTANLLDYFPEDTLLILDEPARLTERGGVLEKEFSESMLRREENGSALPGQLQMLASSKEVLARCMNMTGVMLPQIGGNDGGLKADDRFYLHQISVNSYENSLDNLKKELVSYQKKKYRVYLLTASRTRGSRLASDLREEGLNVFFSEKEDAEVKPGQILITTGFIRRGFEYPDIRVVYISESDIFGAVKKKKKKKKRYGGGDAVTSFSELTPGDYVVHEDHGLGIYEGVKKIEHDHVTRDYIEISYAGGSTLYILATQLDTLSKYGSIGDKKPKLNSLGDGTWKKTKAKVKHAVGEVAKDLVDLYALRQQNQGYVYGPDTEWQKEFEESFPYDETDSQISAIEDVKSDMESPKIMDRLVCGDVGFGKTEIAMRAAFKAVQENKQVVYLVPTTILAQQHYNNFRERMKNYPVSIGMLSRFNTPAKNKETIKGLKNGTLDIVIGTHRVLSKDVGFRDLGLLIIDEEQRFGVAHKEKIKELKKNIDVMSLSATPIPRTLHMSMTGIRDMSLLEDPPMDRTPIQTFVFEENEEMVREAVERELDRGGQVYYVINRINQIADVAAKIQEMVPDANVAYAHGQMSKNRLEEIMTDFVNRDIDVLVATTIIEIGLDISNVNTIIIQDADKFGLSQLYQLRGRVGRGSRTAFAFLMYKRDKILKEVAEKRLAAIKEFTDLGSGYKIAMRDLEIRGAGNLLGREQSGHMESVGYELYCKMLNAAVAREKGLNVGEEYETTVDIPVNAFIPPSYIKDEETKLDMYKRISSIETEEDESEILDELIDRFGEPAKSVQNLLLVARLRAQAHSVYLTKIKQSGSDVVMTFWDKAKIDVSRISEVLDAFSPYLTFVPTGETPALILKTGRDNRFPKGDILQYLLNVCEKLSTILLK